MPDQETKIAQVGNDNTAQISKLQKSYDYLYAKYVELRDIIDGGIEYINIQKDTIKGHNIEPQTITNEEIEDAAIIASKIATDAVTAIKIATSAVDITKFADGIQPIEILDTLPTFGNQGRTVFLTTDNKIYRDTGSAWTVAVVGTDITANSIEAGQIKAGAIGTDQLAANAVTAAKIAANTITASQIYAGTIGTDQLAALAITADKIAASAVTTVKLDALAVTAEKIAAGTITAVKYAELRNTYVFNGDDSLDASFPFELDFEIVSEMTAIVSIKLSFRISQFRAYSTGVPSGGGSTTVSGGSVSGLYTEYTNIPSTPYDHRHSFGTPNHAHATPNHAHGITYGIYEDSQSPTIHFHTDNGGAGYGAAGDNYTTDQLDIDITASFSGVGFKRIKFDSNARCRIRAWVMCKVDITA